MEEGVKRYLRGINLLAGEAEGMVYYYVLNEHGMLLGCGGKAERVKPRMNMMHLEMRGIQRSDS